MVQTKLKFAPLYFLSSKCPGHFLKNDLSRNFKVKHTN